MTEHRDTPITAIYTDIGRGHPNYLDSVLRYMKKHQPGRHQQVRVVSIFAISHGLSLLGWRLIRRVYRIGSRGGFISILYGRFRSVQSDHNPDSRLIRLLRRDLCDHLKGYKGICLVAHPLLAKMLKDRHRVFYLHGEIAAPIESAITGVERVYVPLRETREKMLSLGVSPDSLVETGLVLEPELCVNLAAVVRQRIERIQSDRPLTIGFFISGAYPGRHKDLIVEGVRSCHRAGLKVRIFWGCDSREVSRLAAALRELSDEIVIDDANGSAIPDAPIVIVTAKSREAETVRSMEYLPGLDLFCAAPHERINWAIGAGLPMIIITPPIGTFAPENRTFVLKSGCGLELPGDVGFMDLGREITRARQNGQLLKMAEAGLNIEFAHGAKAIAEDLFSRMA